MTNALILFALATATAAVIVRLRTNHRRVTAWPRSDDASDRDTARLRTDLVAARSATTPAAARPRVVPGGVTGRRVAPPSVRAA